MGEFVIVYARSHSGQPQTGPDMLRDLQQDVERRGDVVVGSYSDLSHLTGKGKNAGWRKMLGNLEGVDQIVVGSVGDLPGRKVDDLLAILPILRERRIALRVHREVINTTDGADAILDLIATYRRSRLSLSIQAGQARARALGKKVGRPEIPKVVRQRIQIALADGGGIRRTAKSFNVSPGTIVNIKRAIQCDSRIMTAAS